MASALIGRSTLGERLLGKMATICQLGSWKSKWNPTMAQEEACIWSHFMSPDLFQQLQKKNVGACGTVRHNRRSIPAVMQAASTNQRKGDNQAFLKKGQLLGDTLHDTTRVNVLSIVRGTGTVENVFCNRRAESGHRTVKKPQAIDSYNQARKDNSLVLLCMIPNVSTFWALFVARGLWRMCSAIDEQRVDTALSRSHKPSTATIKQERTTPWRHFAWYQTCQRSEHCSWHGDCGESVPQ